MGKISKTLLLVLTILLTLLITSAFTNAPAAHAATTHFQTSKSAHIPNAGGYTLGNFVNALEYDYLGSVTISPHQSGTITITRTISNTYSGTVTLSAQFVSAQVGFSVTQSYSIAIACGFTNNTNSQQSYTADAVMQLTDYNIFLGGRKVGTGVASEYTNQIYCA